MEQLEQNNNIDTIEGWKQCVCCKTTKHLSEFKAKLSLTRIYTYCHSCRKMKHREISKRFKVKDIIDSIEGQYKLKDKHFIILSKKETIRIQYPGKSDKYVSYYNIKCDCGVEKAMSTRSINYSISCNSAGCEYSRNGLSSRQSIIEDTNEDGFFIKKGIWNDYCSSANRRNIEFKISPSDVLELWKKQKGLCNKTGRPLSPGSPRKRKSHNWSINRIDSKKGYTVDNIELVHKLCNLVQNKFDDKVLDTFCMSRAVQIINNNPEYASELKEILRRDKEDPRILDEIWKKGSKYKYSSTFKGVHRSVIYKNTESEKNTENKIS